VSTFTRSSVATPRPAPIALSSPPATSRTARILIVDDEAMLLDILAEHFINASYEVETAASGVDALTSVVRGRPDVVLLDIKMPRMSGIEVLKDILKIDPTITVIMVSGASDVGVTAEAFRHGAFAFVPKPFDFRYLLHLIAVSVNR
jgi:DNA-binding NtrC family response regulator